MSDQININGIPLSSLFEKAVDLDEFKHSWHIDCKKYYEKDVRDRIKNILKKKQADRESELKFLYDVEKILMSQKNEEDD